MFLSKLQAGPHILSVLHLRIKPAVLTDAAFTQSFPSREILPCKAQARLMGAMCACSSIPQAVTQPSIHSSSTPSPH